MRTTVIIDDKLLKRAKMRAAELNTSLSEIINQALREALRPKSGSPLPPFLMPTHGDPRRPVRHEPDELARLLEADDRAGLGR